MVERKVISGHIQGCFDEESLEAVRPALAPARVDKQIARARVLLETAPMSWSELDLQFMLALLKTYLDYTRPPLTVADVQTLYERAGVLVA